MRRTFVWIVLSLLLTAPAVLAADEPAAAAPATGKPALLVMDIQNAYLPYMDATTKDISMYMINAAIDLFRANGCPIIRVYHTDPKEGPPPGTEPFEFPASVHVRADDPKVVKNFPSAFKKTELEKILRDRGCDTVFICGLSAVGCALATYFDARGLDFNTFMVKDALMSHRADLTRSVEEITEAVGFDAISYMVARPSK